jgi:hypothetical protein
VNDKNKPTTFTQIYFDCECGHGVDVHWNQEVVRAPSACGAEGCSCEKYEVSFRARTEYMLEHLENRIEELEQKLEVPK